MDKVKVVCRVRPLSNGELAGGGHGIIDVRHRSIIVRNSKQTPGRNAPHGKEHQERVFAFDNCYFSAQLQHGHTLADEQEIIYEEVASDTVGAMLAGYNACILAYGQSGTGKTFTMMGTEEEPGIIPRLCFDILDKTKGTSGNNGLRAESYSVEISFLEIYNERVRDLLSNASTQPSSSDKKRVHLRIREHPKHGAYVQDLSKHSVTDASTVAELLRRGNERRVVAQTDIHDRSSRSHAILTIYFSHACVDGLDAPNETRSKVHLVDLAGSERLGKESSKTRMVEGSSINKSLVTLSSVIAALSKRGNCTRRNQGPTSPKQSPIMPNEGSSLTSPPNGYQQKHHSPKPSIQQTTKSSVNQDTSKVPFVPYRDSVLTRLLKDCLGGNSKTTMIATLSPSSTCHTETITTLRYAQRAKHIVNCPRINEDSNARLIRELRMEIKALRSKLSDLNDIRLWSLNPILTRKETIEATVLANEERAQRLTQEWIRKHLGGTVCEVGVQTIGDHGYGGPGSRMDVKQRKWVDTSSRCTRSTEPSSSSSTAVSPTSSERTSIHHNTSIAAVDYDSGTEMSSINRPESPYSARSWCYACRKQRKSPEPSANDTKKPRQRKLTREGNVSSSLSAPQTTRRVHSVSPCGKRLLGNPSLSLDVHPDGASAAKSSSAYKRRRVRSISSPEGRRADNTKSVDRSPFGSSRSLNSVASVASTSKLHSACHHAAGSYQTTTFSFTRHMTSRSPVPSSRARRRGCQVCSSQESCSSDVASSSPDLRSRRATEGSKMTKQEVIEAAIKRLYPGSNAGAGCHKKKLSAPARLQSTSSSYSSTTCHRGRRQLHQPPPRVKETPTVVDLGGKPDNWQECLMSDVKHQQICLPRRTRFHSPILDSAGCLSLPMTSIPSVRIEHHEMCMSDDSLDASETNVSFERDSLDGSDYDGRINVDSRPNNHAITYSPMDDAADDMHLHCWHTAAEQDQQLVVYDGGLDTEADFEPAEASEAIIERGVTLETHAASSDNGNDGGTQNCTRIYATTAFSAPTCDSSHRRPLSPVPRSCKSLPGDFRANFGEETPSNCINIVLDYSATSPTRLYTIAESNHEIGSDMSDTELQDRLLVSPADHVESGDDNDIRQENQLAEEAEFSNPVFKHDSDVWQTTECDTSADETPRTVEPHQKQLIGLISNEEDDTEVLVITGCIEDADGEDSIDVVGAVGGTGDLTVPVRRKKSEKSKKEAIKDIMAIFGQVQGQIQQQISHLEEQQAKLNESMAAEAAAGDDADDEDRLVPLVGNCDESQHGQAEHQVQQQGNEIHIGEIQAEEVRHEVSQEPLIDLSGSAHEHEDLKGSQQEQMTCFENPFDPIQSQDPEDCNDGCRQGYLYQPVFKDSELTFDGSDRKVTFEEDQNRSQHQMDRLGEQQAGLGKESLPDQDEAEEPVTKSSLQPGVEYSDSFCEDSHVTGGHSSSSQPTKEEVGDPSDVDEECCEVNPPLIVTDPHSIFAASHLERLTGNASMDDVDSIPEELEALDSSTESSSISCSITIEPLLSDGFGTVGCEVRHIDLRSSPETNQSQVIHQKIALSKSTAAVSRWGEEEVEEIQAVVQPKLRTVSLPGSSMTHESGPRRIVWADNSDAVEETCDEEAVEDSEEIPETAQLKRRSSLPAHVERHEEDSPRAAWGYSNRIIEEDNSFIRLDPSSGIAKFIIDNDSEVSGDEPEEASCPYERRSGSLLITQSNNLLSSESTGNIGPLLLPTNSKDANTEDTVFSLSADLAGQSEKRDPGSVEKHEEVNDVSDVITQTDSPDERFSTGHQQAATSSEKSSIEETSELSSSDDTKRQRSSPIRTVERLENDVELRGPIRDCPQALDSPGNSSSGTYPGTSSSDHSGGENAMWFRQTREMASHIVREVISLAKERVSNGALDQASLMVNGRHDNETSTSNDEAASEAVQEEVEPGIHEDGNSTSPASSSSHASPPPNTPFPSAVVPEVAPELSDGPESPSAILTTERQLSLDFCVNGAKPVVSDAGQNILDAPFEQVPSVGEASAEHESWQRVEDQDLPCEHEAVETHHDGHLALPMEVDAQTPCFQTAVESTQCEPPHTPAEMETTDAPVQVSAEDGEPDMKGVPKDETSDVPLTGPLPPHGLQTEEGVFSLTCIDDPFADIDADRMEFTDLAELANQIMRENDFLSLETIPEMSREEYSLRSSENLDSLHSSANQLHGLKSAATEETEPGEEFAEKSLIWMNETKPRAYATTEVVGGASGAAMLNTTKILQSTMSQLDCTKSAELSAGAFCAANDEAQESSPFDRSWEEHFIKVDDSKELQPREFVLGLEERLFQETEIDDASKVGEQPVEEIQVVEAQGRSQSYLEEDTSVYDLSKNVELDDHQFSSIGVLSESQEAVVNQQLFQEETSVEEEQHSTQQTDVDFQHPSLRSPEPLENPLLQSNYTIGSLAKEQTLTESKFLERSEEALKNEENYDVDESSNLQKTSSWRASDESITFVFIGSTTRSPTKNADRHPNGKTPEDQRSASVDSFDSIEDESMQADAQAEEEFENQRRFQRPHSLLDPLSMTKKKSVSWGSLANAGNTEPYREVASATANMEQEFRWRFPQPEGARANFYTSAVQMSGDNFDLQSPTGSGYYNREEKHRSSTVSESWDDTSDHGSPYAPTGQKRHQSVRQRNQVRLRHLSQQIETNEEEYRRLFLNVDVEGRASSKGQPERSKRLYRSISTTNDDLGKDLSKADQMLAMRKKMLQKRLHEGRPTSTLDYSKALRASQEKLLHGTSMNDFANHSPHQNASSSSYEDVFGSRLDPFAATQSLPNSPMRRNLQRHHSTCAMTCCCAVHLIHSCNHHQQPSFCHGCHHGCHQTTFNNNPPTQQTPITRTPLTRERNGFLPSPSNYLQHLVSVRRQIVQNTRMLGNQCL